jgi:hypothetical protein
MFGFIFRKEQKDIRSMTTKELSRGIRLRAKTAPVLRWTPLALGFAATLAVFALVPGLGMGLGLIVSLGVSWGVQKLTAPHVGKIINRISREQHAMEGVALSRIAAREAAEKLAAKQPAVKPASGNAPQQQAKPLTGDFESAGVKDVLLKDDVTVRKGPLKLKKPGVS